MEPSTYTMTRVDDVILIAVQGRVWGTIEAYQLKDEVRVQLAQGRRRFLIDLGAVDAVNSVGTGILISALIGIQREGGRLAVAGLNDRSRTALDLVGVLPLLELHDTPESALAAIRRD